uniref:Uncharacterized protein n=2 Tax=Lotus japonicus TaxID=34305 RepID=I3SH12_LOTJA|nr:unknown [Lotus japonicus]
MEGEEESLEEPLSANGGQKDKRKNKKKTKKGKNKDKGVEEIISEVRKSSNEESDAEEDDFWMPPVGERWDYDDGRDRWGSDLESEEETEEGDVIDGAADEDCKESEELSSRTKRMSIEVGPSSFASRKKKSKKNHQT